MKNDKHFTHRLVFMAAVLVLVGAVILGRLVQIQLVEGSDTLKELRPASSMSAPADASGQAA